MKTLLIALATCALGLLLAVLGFLALYLSMPDASKITQCPKAAMSGALLCETSPGYVQLANINPYLIDAVLIAEDAAFYHHDGFDWREIKNSFWTNIQRGHLARGGSTITQQLAKNVFLSREKTFTRKITEALLAHDLEQRLSKNKILEYYLNVVEFGPNIYGLQKASYFYFGKHPSELSLTESAYLAFLLPNPKVYSRSRLPDQLSPFAEERIREILSRLKRYDKVTDQEHIAARRELGDHISSDENSEEWNSVSANEESELEVLPHFTEKIESTTDEEPTPVEFTPKTEIEEPSEASEPQSTPST